MKNYLEFEKEIKALEQEVDSLKQIFILKKYFQNLHCCQVTGIMVMTNPLLQVLA